MNLWLIPLALLVFLSSVAFVPTPSPWVDPADALNSGDIAWMLTATGLVLLMTPGLSLFYGGMVGTRNIISTMLQSFICLGVVSIVWVIVGFSLAFGDSFSGIIGNPLTFLFF
jgi:Amt family ammonium transporter